MASDVVVEGTESAPTAGTAIVTTGDLEGGLYAVQVSAHLEGSGTPGAADLDNIALYVATTEVSALPVAEAKSVLFATPFINVEVPAGDTLSVEAVGNATSEVVYAVTMVVRHLSTA
jgi:hypothetical protein